MTKQRITLKLQMDCSRCRNKALKIAAEIDGVNSVAIEGSERDLVVVRGEDVDTISLGKLMKKKFRCVILQTVEDLDQQEKDKKERERKEKEKKEKEEKDKKEKAEKEKIEKEKQEKEKKQKEEMERLKKELEMARKLCPTVSVIRNDDHDDTIACSNCDSIKCDGTCKACSACDSHKCHGECRRHFRPPPCCPPWNPCLRCYAVKFPPPPAMAYSDPCSYRVVYDSNPDSCSIQ